MLEERIFCHRFVFRIIKQKKSKCHRLYTAAIHYCIRYESKTKLIVSWKFYELLIVRLETYSDKTESKLKKEI